MKGRFLLVDRGVTDGQDVPAARAWERFLEADVLAAISPDKGLHKPQQFLYNFRLRKGPAYQKLRESPENTCGVNR